MFRKKKKKHGKKIVANTDGDRFPEEMVKQAREVAKKVGESATKDVSDPELLAALQREMAETKAPGPEDVYLLYMYARGAITPEKAIPVPEDEENETLMLYLYSDGYVLGAGNLVFVSPLGMRRLFVIGAIDDKGKIIAPLK